MPNNPTRDSNGFFRSFGWRPDVPDARDYSYRVTLRTLPDSIDFRDKLPPVKDQQDLGACTAFGSLAAYEYDHARQSLAVPDGSELFQYYNARRLEHTTGYDAGATVRDSIKALAKYGVCTERQWPYHPEKFAKKPNNKCYTSAKKERIVQYFRVDNRNQQTLMGALAGLDGVVFGMAVYESFMKIGSDGIMSLPDISREYVLGGHCMFLCGYKSFNNVLYAITRNSWGEGWGDKGYCYIPIAYLTNTDFADDFWVIQTVR